MAWFPAELFVVPPGAPSDLLLHLVRIDDSRPLHAACFSDKPLTQFRSHFEKMLNWQGNGRCCWLVACDESGQIVGSGELVVYPHGSELANLFVIPARRSEGIGTALIEVLTAVARHLVLDGLEIGVSVVNGRALHLYQRLGFSIDRQVALPCQEPVLILRKEL